MTIVKRAPRSGKRLLTMGWMAAVAVALLPVSGCKDFGSPDYQLDITLEPGVVGTPAAGHYAYKDLAQVTYSYSAQNTDLAVVMAVNDITFAAAGTLTMYCNMNVVVKVLDIRGNWSVTLTPSDTSASQIKITLLLDGSGPATGSCSDDQGHTGSWAIASQTLTVTFANWEKFILTGTVGTTMSGSYSNGDSTGTWTAARPTT